MGPNPSQRRAPPTFNPICGINTSANMTAETMRKPVQTPRHFGYGTRAAVTQATAPISSHTS